MTSITVHEPTCNNVFEQTVRLDDDTVIDLAISSLGEPCSLVISCGAESVAALIFTKAQLTEIISALGKARGLLPVEH